MCKKNVSINEFSQHLTKYIIVASIMRPISRMLVLKKSDLKFFQKNG